MHVLLRVLYVYTPTYLPPFTGFLLHSKINFIQIHSVFSELIYGPGAKTRFFGGLHGLYSAQLHLFYTKHLLVHGLQHSKAFMSPSSHATAAEEKGVEILVGMSGKKKTSRSIKATKNTDERGAADIQRDSSRSNSPNSQLDFDVMATRDDDGDHLKMNHSHNAYEIQRKTQAMRELDLLSGDDDYSDGTESVSMSSSSDGSEPKEIKIGRRRPAQHKSRENDWLFSCTLDDIDEVVEELISPFDSTIENIAYFSCQRDNDDSITDNEERL